ncbi:hypothetical protein VKT23_003553 [Stygiomarasmius scandens]|uniref:F-box domain-containing protein n=1 Tax=Marasmiellus scandens TaxID=2682957 RepID=A0ABR1JY14_9AGAR
MDPAVKSQMQSIPLCSRCNHTLDTIERVCPPTIHIQLRSMYQPSETEATRVKNAIDDIENDLDRFDAEIASLTKTLDELKRRKEELMSVRDNFRALTAPVRKLPTEILLDIFSLLCVNRPGLSIVTVNGENVVSLPTLELARTCSHWRNITLSHPILWSNIAIDLAPRTSNVKDLLNLYFVRSRPALLSLSVTAFRLNGVSDDEDTDGSYMEWLPSSSWRLFRSLLDEMPRWYRVSLDLNRSIYELVDSGAYDFEVAMNCHVPSVKHLRLVCGSEWGTQAELVNRFANKLTSAVSLQTLEISGFDISSSIPFGQLTQANLVCHSADKLRGFICSRSHLQTLEISDAFTRTRDVACPIKADSIKCISVSFRWLQLAGMCDMLCLLDAPNLRSLSLYLPGLYAKADFQTMVLKSLKAMVNRSASSLCELTLNGFLLSDEGLIELLPFVPHLQKMILIMDEYYHRIATQTFFSVYIDTCNLRASSRT